MFQFAGLLIIIARWVFILYMLWVIARSLRRIEASLREIANKR
jgi:hypothetical protein